MSHVFHGTIYTNGNIAGQRITVRAATTTAGILAVNFANLSSIDGVTLASGDIILIKDQASADENGIYVVQVAGAPVRHVSMPTGKAANLVWTWIEEGTANANTAWICTSPTSADTVGTDNLTFLQYDVVGTLSVPRGGTGATSFTAGELLQGNGTAPISSSGIVAANLISSAGQGTDNHIVRWDGTGTPNVQDSTNAQIDDADNISGLANVSLSGDILDDNSNELIEFGTVGAAVNHVSITNASTGTSPILAAAGDDANVDLNMTAQGTGRFTFGATGGGTSGILQINDNDDSNFVALSTAPAVTTSYELRFPDAPGAASQVLVSDGNNPAQLSWQTVVTSDTKYLASLTTEVVVNILAPVPVSYFPWDNSRYSAFSTFTCVFYHSDINGGTSLTVQVFDETNSVVRGTVTIPGGTSEGIGTFTFTSPGGDANLAIRTGSGSLLFGAPSVFSAFIHFV